MRRRRRGFTLIEMMVVTVVMGVLAGIALLRYLNLENDALVARIATDMESIRTAALNFHVDAESWPASGSDGVPPNELVPLLPGNVDWTSRKYTYRFLYAGDLVGVIIRSTDPALGAKLRARLVFGAPFAPMGSDVIYIIKAPGVQFL